MGPAALRAGYAPERPPSPVELFDHLSGRRRGCICERRVIDTRPPEIRDGIKAAIQRRDFLSVKILASSPTIPKAICTCKPAWPERLRALRRPRARRPLRRRPPGAQLNTCYTGWPGGLSYTPPGAPLAPGNVRTGFAGGRPTNPRCYPPRAGALLDTSNDGTFSSARRAATLGQSSPDRVAELIGGVSRAVERGTLTPDLGGKIIASAVSPPVAANQAQYRRELETVEERRKRQLAERDTTTANQALEARYVTDVCRPAWCCYDGPTWSTSQNRGVTKDAKVVARNRARGFTCKLLDLARVRARLGHVPSEAEEVGACADESNHLTVESVRALGGQWASAEGRRRADERVTAPAIPAAPLVAGAPAPSAPPPAAAAPAPGEPMLCCQRTPFGFGIGEIICAPLSVHQAAGRYGVYPWS